MMNACIVQSDAMASRYGLDNRQVSFAKDLVAGHLIPKLDNVLYLFFLNSVNIYFAYRVVRTIQKKYNHKIKLVVPFPYCFAVFHSNVFNRAIDCLEICKEKDIEVIYLSENFFNSFDKDTKKFLKDRRYSLYVDKIYEDCSRFVEENVEDILLFMIRSNYPKGSMKLKPTEKNKRMFGGKRVIMSVPQTRVFVAANSQ